MLRGESYGSRSSQEVADWFCIFRGSCPCSHNNTCEDPTLTCNCDANANKWFSDEGNYSGTQSLGITSMYFLHQKDLDVDAKGRITLGPLECVETSMCLW